MIKLIAFDLWGTLAIKGNPFKHFSEIIKDEFKLKLSKQEIIKRFEETLQTRYWETEIDGYLEFIRKIGIEANKENVLKILSIRNKLENEVLVFDFVIPLLKNLKKQGYKTAIVSNSSIFTYDYFKKKTNILKYIDYQHFSFQVGYTKPNPQIYLELQRKVNLYNNEILMIGDNFENDFKAPKQLGINAILFKNYQDLVIELEKYNIKL